MLMAKTIKSELREKISSGFIRVEDLVYVGLGLLLAGGALFLLGNVMIHFVQSIVSMTFKPIVVELLDQILLIMMIIEILSTVQVSFREHKLTPEPFLIVGLIAAIRRVLVLTAEFSRPDEFVEAAFQNAMYELALLTALILSLGLALFLLKKGPMLSVERE
jgi:uncharacterized membrane protein (DUF373 family)